MPLQADWPLLLQCGSYGLKSCQKCTAATIICQIQLVSKVRDKGQPFWSRNQPCWSRNEGPPKFPHMDKYSITAWRAHMGKQPCAIWIKQPLGKRSVLEALILMRKHEGLVCESTAISWTPKWRAAKKDARLGTVNSADHRKPKHPRLHAAQNIQWSGTDRSRILDTYHKRICDW